MSDALRERLTTELGTELVRPARVPGDAVDGRNPTGVVRARSEGDVTRTLRAAARDGLAVLPTGSGSRRALGNPPERAEILLELAALDDVRELAARDQFMVVGAGLTLERAEELARGEGLTLAADLPIPGAGTVGGAVACGANGLSRLAARGARNAVIGLRVAHPDGAVTAHGTRVPKNVAGLDMVKLHVGALGTLGVITEVTLRLRARAPAERTLLVPPCARDAAIAAGLGTVTAGLLPEVVLVTQRLGTGDANDGDPSGAHLAVRFVGEPERVRWQVEELARRLGGTILAESESERHWCAASRALVAPPADRALVLELRCLPDRLAAALADLDALAPALTRTVAAHAASGEARVSLVGHGPEGAGAPDATTTARIVSELRGRMAPRSGSVRVLSAPPASKRGLDVWPDPGRALELMRRTKEALDPSRALNPGRYVARI